MSHWAHLARHPALLLCIALLALLSCTALYYHRILSNFLSYQYWRHYEDGTFSSGFVENRGAQIYYETHGTGEAIILLHGGLSVSSIFFAQMPALAQAHRVIAIDLRGQGRSTLGTQPFDYPLLADDVRAVLDTLGITQSTIIGWSDGGIIALMLSIEAPQLVRRQLLLGANFHPRGLTPSALESIQEELPATASLASRLVYRLYSPHPARWQQLWQELQQMWLNGPVLSPQQLAGITQETLVIAGEFDNISLEHTQELRAALGNAQLQIIAGAGHNLLLERPDLMREIMLRFLRDTP